MPRFWPFGRNTESRASTLRNPFENPTVPLSGQKLEETLEANVGNTAGQRVHEDDALRHSPVWAAIDLISAKISELPLCLQESRTIGERQAWAKATDHPSYQVLLNWIGTLSPGIHQGQMTAQQWLSMSVVNLKLYGNAYTWIARNRLGQAIELRPIHPVRVSIYRRTGDPGDIWFYVNPVTTSTMRGSVDVRVPPWISQRDMLHFRHMAPIGHWGMSPIRYGARSIGRNMSGEDYISEFYLNDANPGGIFIPDGRLSTDAKNIMLRSWRERHEGGGRHHKFSIAEVPGKYESIGVNPENGRLVDVLTYGVRDVARIFRLPAHYLQDPTSNAYNSNIEEGKRFLRNTLQPDLCMMQAELDVKIPAIPEVGEIRCRFDTSQYTRGEISASDYRQYIEAGVFSPNEVREALGHNPREGGDEFLTPLNMQSGSDSEADDEPDSEGEATPEEGRNGKPKESVRFHHGTNGAALRI